MFFQALGSKPQSHTIDPHLDDMSDDPRDVYEVKKRQRTPTIRDHMGTLPGLVSGQYVSG